MLGDGVAIMPISNKVVSPADGVITLIYDTQHAIGIRTDEGDEILIHMGIDTVNLKGKPFKTKVKVNQHVQAGELLSIVNWRYIEKKGLNTVVPIIVMDTNASVVDTKEEGAIQLGEAIFNIEEAN